MRIVLVSSFVPFIKGGARFIVEWLEGKLQESGHQVERFYLPFVESEDVLLEQLLAYRLLDISENADRLIAFRPPSHIVRHPNKVLWFIHHIRGYYDLMGTPYQSFQNTNLGHATREALVQIDTVGLKEARRVFSNSQIVANRLKAYNGIEATPLYPPIFAPERFYHSAYGDEIVSICRIEPHKRQFLLVDAMRFTKTPVRLRLCGRSASPAYEKQINSLIAASPAADRIVFDNRWISEEEKAERLASALAVAYLPVDEDSYGYPSLEAAHARKPVITLDDAGGVLEFVDNEKNGLVSEADPRAIAHMLDRLFEDRAMTERLGANSRNRITELKIDWNHVVESVTS